MSIWSGFFKKTLRERQDQISLVYPHLDMGVLDDGGLPGSVADVMVRLTWSLGMVCDCAAFLFTSTLSLSLSCSLARSRLGFGTAIVMWYS